MKYGPISAAIRAMIKIIAYPRSVVCTLSPEDVFAARRSRATCGGRQPRCAPYTSERWRNRICPAKFAYLRGSSLEPMLGSPPLRLLVEQIVLRSRQRVNAVAPDRLGAMDQDIRFCTSADGVSLAFAVSGEGPPLVMSATWLTHLEHQCMSLALQPWLDAFARDHKLLRHDSRGCGLAD